MCMVVDIYPNVVGISDGAMCHSRSSTRSMNVHARSTERGVGEMAVVNGGVGSSWNLDTVLAQTGVVVRGIKLLNRETL